MEKGKSEKRGTMRSTAFFVNSTTATEDSYHAENISTETRDQERRYEESLRTLEAQRAATNIFNVLKRYVDHRDLNIAEYLTKKKVFHLLLSKRG